MSLVESSTSERDRQLASWRASRARIAAAAIDRPKPIKSAPADRPYPIAAQVIELVPPTTDPARDTMDIIIAAVGVALDVLPTEILAGESSEQIVSARRLAMALCVRRLQFTVERVAGYFEVIEASVVDAVRVLDPILVAWSISNKMPLAMALQPIAKGWTDAAEAVRKRPTMRAIQDSVCEVWGVTRNEILSPCRNDRVTVARHAAAAICKVLTIKSLPEIGRSFGARDHTTMLHAVRRYEPIIHAVSQSLSVANSPTEWAVAVFEASKIIPRAKVKK